MSEQAILETPEAPEAEVAPKKRSVKVVSKPNYISRQERRQISRELEKHHAIFKRLWQMSRIRFSKRIPTAAVLFNKKGKCIDFIVNREFWESKTFMQKCFILAHECLHIAFNHGQRSVDYRNNPLKWQISNHAQDLVINHALVNRYGFVRQEIDPPIPLEEVLPLYEEAMKRNPKAKLKMPTQEELDKGHYCWIDKYWPDGSVKDHHNYEFYYNLLIRMAEENLEKLKEMLENAETVDDHDANQTGTPMPMDGSGEGDEEGEEGDEEGEEGEGEGDGAEGEGEDGQTSSNGQPEGEGEISDMDPEDYNYWDSEDHTDDFSDVIDKLDDEMPYHEKEGLENFLNENENIGEDTRPDQEFPEENPNYGPTGESAGFQDGQSGGTQAGTTAGRGWTFAKKLKPKRKHKFEHIITSWAKKRMTDEYKVIDQWVHPNRRFMMLDQEETGLILPAEHESMERENKYDKIEVWFYQDTSGSCAGYKDRFFAIAEAMPLERFDMRMFCFDTLVYETSLESRKLYGGGGTYFHILEEHIQQEMAENKKQRYPDAIFVVTDGFGSPIVPDKPERWHWMLTPHQARDCIPEKCNFYNLSDYE